MKTLFSVSAAATMLLGIGWLAAPAMMLTRWDVTPDAAGIMMGRRYGIVFIGLGVLLWLSRNAPRSAALTAVLGGASTAVAGLAVITLLGLLNGTLGPTAWASFAVEAILSVGFLYFLRMSLADSGGSSA